MNYFLNYVITILSIIIPSIFLGMIDLSILFILSFVPIRMTLGGFHCKTPINCLISFNLIYIFHLFIVTHLPNYFNLSCVLLIIILMASKPYIHINKTHLSNKNTNIKKNIILFFNLMVFILINNITLRRSLFISTLINFELYIFVKFNNQIKNLPLYSRK